MDIIIDSINKKNIVLLIKYLNELEYIEYDNEDNNEQIDELIFSILKLWDPHVSELFLSKIDKIKLKTDNLTVGDKYEIEYIESYTIKFLTMFFGDKSIARDVWKIFDEDRLLSQNIGKIHIFFIEKCISFIDLLDEHNKNNNVSKDIIINDMKMVKIIINYVAKFLPNNKIINEVLLSIPDDLEDDWKTSDILDNFQNIPLLFI